MLYLVLREPCLPLGFTHSVRTCLVIPIREENVFYSKHDVYLVFYAKKYVKLLSMLGLSLLQIDEDDEI